jgi:hypothetical protein
MVRIVKITPDKLDYLTDFARRMSALDALKTPTGAAYSGVQVRSHTSPAMARFSSASTPRDQSSLLDSHGGSPVPPSPTGPPGDCSSLPGAMSLAISGIGPAGCVINSGNFFKSANATGLNASFDVSGTSGSGPWSGAAFCPDTVVYLGAGCSGTAEDIGPDPLGPPTIFISCTGGILSISVAIHWNINNVQQVWQGTVSVPSTGSTVGFDLLTTTPPDTSHAILTNGLGTLTW